jgi:hypothetical protein
MGRRTGIARALTLTTVALAVGAPPTHAAPPWAEPIRDCASNGRLDKHYPRDLLKEALAHMHADRDEYSDCTNALRAAYEGGTGRPEGPPPAGIVTESGAVAEGDADIAALQEIQATAGDAPAPVRIGATSLAAPGPWEPPALGLTKSNALPTPLALPLAGLVLLLALTTATAIRQALTQRRH